ncbi:MAG: cyanoexosortase B [Cyanophyceae cyanobacterium]
MVQTRKLSLVSQNWLNFLILACLVLLYAPVLVHWYDGWLNKTIGIEHEYFSHGIIGLPFAGYLSWINRKKWRRLPNQAHPFGAGLLVVGAAMYLTGTPQLVNLSFPALLSGLVLWLKGVPGLQMHSIPLLLVLLATPNAIPYLITPYTLPLQQFIAGTAAFILLQFGLEVSVQEIYLTVGGRIVEVAPYCAGLKMLFTSLYVAFMLLCWTDNLGDRHKMTLLLSGTAIIAVISNILRNTLLTFFYGTGQEELFHWLHDSWGGDLYLAGTLGSIILLLKVLDSGPLDSPRTP